MINEELPPEERIPDDQDDDVQRWDPNTDPDGYDRKRVMRKDWYLDLALDVYFSMDDDNPEGVIGLTITSNGFLVSGLAISRRAWIDATVEQHKQVGSDVSWMEEYFNEFHEDTVAEGKRRREAGLPHQARQFFHMKDVRIGTADDYVEVPLWRGSLADVTGWTFGSWNPKQDPEASE